MFFSRFGGSLNPLNQVKDRNTIDTTKDTTAGTQAKDQWRQTVSEEKKAAVHEEMKRMNQLPSNSTYATHRLRVLNKVLHLLSIQRTTSQDEELELLFAGLSLWIRIPHAHTLNNKSRPLHQCWRKFSYKICKKWSADVVCWTYKVMMLTTIPNPFLMLQSSSLLYVFSFFEALPVLSTFSRTL